MRVKLSHDYVFTEEGLPKSVEVALAFDYQGTVPVDAILAAVAKRLAPSPVPEEASNGDAEPLAMRASAASHLIGSTWRKPDLHGKALRTVHRVVLELSKEDGLGVKELHERSQISLPALYKVLKDDQPQGEYASKYIRATKVGRSQVLDLTSEGKLLASLIRAKKVPA